LSNMLFPDLYKPIRNFGYFFVIIGLCGFLFLFAKLQSVEQIIAVWLFIGSISLFHLLLGIGIILKKKLWFGFFKAYLQGMYIAFPIGTILSKKTLEYIEKNNIEHFIK